MAQDWSAGRVERFISVRQASGRQVKGPLLLAIAAPLRREHTRETLVRDVPSAEPWRLLCKSFEIVKARDILRVEHFQPAFGVARDGAHFSIFWRKTLGVY